jgi:hypothetical protein
MAESDDIDKTQILEYLRVIIYKQAVISELINGKLCCPDNTSSEEWIEKRQKISRQLEGLVEAYKFSARLPRNYLGITAQAAMSYLLKIQCTFANVSVMMDMTRNDSFNEIYMDSLTNIARKVNEQFLALSSLVQLCEENPESAISALETVQRLEREIDEDNIVICRQISTATGGTPDFLCYMMRKIVSDLEHISDYVKECAVIIAEI